jgi:NhaP-type Na+/H+ or K+/H+ antiporter
MSVARLISLWVFSPWICKWGYGISTNELIIIIWGGLRGAVGISFALIAGTDPDLDPAFRDIFLFDMSGCAVLTLIINAPTTGITYKFVITLGYLIDHLGILV